jgi:predicted LPLAT superfamily acyltransferase
MVSTPARIAALMPGRAVGVGGDLHVGHVRLVDDRLHLLEGQLLGARRVAAREDAAGGADLDHPRAVLAHGAHLMAALLGTVDQGRALLVHRGREECLVAVPAGRAQRIGRRHDPRARDEALVDRLAQAHVGIEG